MIRHITRRMIPFLVAALFAVACADSPPLKIGVLLPLTGSMDASWRVPLDWALQNVNDAGGIAGRKLELVYVDSTAGDIKNLAQNLIDDPEIVGVIGPATSDELFALAPLFIKAEKPLVSPAATSADIFRAFGGQNYIWRTLESDVAQVRSLLVLAQQQNSGNIAMLAADNSYGATFFDWFGFMATELGLPVSAVTLYDPATAPSACAPAVAEALRNGPDSLLLVPAGPDDLPCMVREARKINPKITLFASDSARFDYVLDALGDDGNDLQGVSLAADPASGFAIAYEEIFGTPAPAFAANSYDTLLLLAYGLARSGGDGGEALALGMQAAVDGRGEATGWDAQGVRNTLAAFAQGRSPDIRGAASPMDYDADFYTELVSSVYAHWRIEYGAFVDVAFFSTADTRRTHSNQSAFRSLASEDGFQNLEDQGIDALPAREHIWALIAATSSGWKNYRHQADALAQYQLLRKNGIPDERIVLILADDLTENPKNNLPGVVRNDGDGENLYRDVEIDYRLFDVDCDGFMNILAGRKTEATPTVIEAGSRDNLYVFIVGHGGSPGVGWDADPVTSDVDFCLLKPDRMAAELAERYENGGYRRALVVVESCHGGVMGLPLAAPQTLLISGANPYENSLATNYDLGLHAWVADDFAYRYWTHAADDAAISIPDLYESLYFQVQGSHVSIFNSASIGQIRSLPLSEFIVE